MASEQALPTDGLLPRLTASQLTESTGANGRDVTIAVFDTGVDPGASGLSVTADGQRKIVDLVDCTSAGDVDMQSRKLNEDSTLKGLSGRTLRITEEIKQLNTTNDYFIGLKYGFNFFPRNLVTRLRRERKEVWQRKHKKEIAQVRLSLTELKQKSKDQSDENSNVEITNKVLIQEMEARVSVLSMLEKNYEDIGPVFDCIVFYDKVNSMWRAIVDTSENGDIDQCDILEDFAINGKFSQFPNGVMLNFATNIYNDGKKLSIVVDCGSHGTHVAGIVAANYPDSPHLNGIAPNAKIVSLKIGDARLHGMETHQGIMRAVAYCLAHSPKQSEIRNKLSSASKTAKESEPTPTVKVEKSTIKPSAVSASSKVSVSSTWSKSEDKESKDSTKASTTSKPAVTETSPDSSEMVQTSNRPNIVVDVVNMSYGEYTRDADKGKFIKLVNDLVRKHNVIFVSSAGNQGPALSTVSAPGGTTSSVIGVAAFCTSEMLSQAYSLLDFEYKNTAPTTKSTSNSLKPTTGLDRDVSDGEKAEKSPVIGTLYTWSSRGPLANGYLGVSIAAPGGAVAPVPVWNLKKKQLMNGTSMSSPSAAGTISVILSYLKMKKIPYTSALVRRGVENSARPLIPIHHDQNDQESTNKLKNQEMAFSVGYGCIDAYAACQYIENYVKLRKRPRTVTGSMTTATSKAQNDDGPYLGFLENCGDSSLCLENWHIKVSVKDIAKKERSRSSNGAGSLQADKGVYLRGLVDTQKVNRISVSVSLIGYEQQNGLVKEALSNLEVTVRLSCDANWVKVPKYFVLLGNDSIFNMIVDPTKLTAGVAHFTQVEAYVHDKNNGNGNGSFSGPIFRVPISVHKPESLVNGLTIKPIESISFFPGKTFRRFYAVPEGASFAHVRITAGKDFLGKGTEKMDHRTNTIDDKSTSTSVNGILDTSVEENDAENKNISVETDMDITKVDKMSESGQVRNFSLHVVQVLPQKHCDEVDSRESLNLYPGKVSEALITVHSSSTMELCIAQSLTSAGKCTIEKVELTFAGLIVKPSSIHATSACLTFPRVEISCGLPIGCNSTSYTSGYVVSGSLTDVRRGLSCYSSSLESLSSSSKMINRDTITEISKTGLEIINDKPIYQLKLEYCFGSFADGSRIELMFPTLNSTVYESLIEGGPFVVVQDINKRYMYSSDIYSAERSFMKGDYYATAYIRSDNFELLENLKDTLQLTVQYSLNSDITLSPYESGHAACFSFNSRSIPDNSSAIAVLDHGERRAFYFKTPKRSDLPKWINAGDYLSGPMVIDRITNSRNPWSIGREIPSYPISFTVTSDSKRTPKSETNKNKGSTDEKAQAQSSDEKEKTSKDKEGENKTGHKKKEENDQENVEIEGDSDKWMVDELKKLRLKRLESAIDDPKEEKKFLKIFDFMHKKYGDDIEMLVSKVRWADKAAFKLWDDDDEKKDDKDKSLAEKVKVVVESVDYVVSKMNLKEIIEHFAYNVDENDRKATKAREGFTKDRDQLIECLFRKVRSQSLLLVSKQKANDFEGNEKYKQLTEEFENEGIKELSKWISMDEDADLPASFSQDGLGAGVLSHEEFLVVLVIREARHGRYGSALKHLDNFYGSAASKVLDSKRVISLREDIYKALHWQHLAERHGKDYRTWRFPEHPMPY